jgi:hypothetical protein
MRPAGYATIKLSQPFAESQVQLYCQIFLVARAPVLMASSKFKNVFDSGGAGVLKRQSSEIGLPHAIPLPKRLRLSSACFNTCDHQASALGHRYELELATRQHSRYLLVSLLTIQSGLTSSSKQVNNIRMSEHLAAPVLCAPCKSLRLNGLSDHCSYKC